MAVSRDHAPATESYRTILKSSSLIGGSTLANILIGMVRVKFVATLIGPVGVGIVAVYSQITSMVGLVSGMGLDSSGVRQVAEAAGTGDQGQVARTVKTLRRTVWLTGGLGMLVMALFCVPLSWVSFGSREHAVPIALLGATVLLSAVTSGQACVLRGTRRIADLAKIGILGAVNATVISVPCYYFWGQRGILPSLLLSALASLATSWWFARRVPIKAAGFSWRSGRNEMRRLLTLGISLMGGGVAGSLSSYVIMAFLIRRFDLKEIGLYQTAFALSGILIGFVLGAMGMDYYPRLTAVAHDNGSVHRLVNEQAQVSILLGLPGLAAMMVFAPLAVRIFYTPSFAEAVPILRWFTLGLLARVFAWPLAFVMLAKGRGKLFFITEVAFGGLHVLAVYVACNLFGLVGTGMAFMAMYVLYTVAMLAVMERLVGATWTRHTQALTLLAITVMTVLMLNCNLSCNQAGYWAVNLPILAGVSWFCLSLLSKKTGLGWNDLLARCRKNA